ncbi:MAG: 6-phosphofructokinase [Kiritimatiellia bacterium]
MKKDKVAGNMLIAQSGGHGAIRKIYGSLHGIRGVLEENLIDLRRETPANLELVAATPSSALGTVRHKPTPEDCKMIFNVLRRYDVRYFFYIGGNDSAETAHIVNEQSLKVGYQLNCLHIPKTIDNDLRENDHTPGFGSAARFVACAVMGDDLDNRALPGVKIDVVMGRHAGFLTAASALARSHPDDGPHLIYLPEKPFSMSGFIRDVKAVYARLGRCMVVVSEGIADEKGETIAAKFLAEKDSHGNVQLSGSGALGDLLAAAVRAKAGISRVRADTFGYLQRSFPGLLSEVDAREARAVGVEAVRLAVKGCSDGSVAIRRKPGRQYRVVYERVPLSRVARETRSMPASFINRSGNNVTEAFLRYARPIVGELPRVGYLKDARVARKK